MSRFKSRPKQWATDKHGRDLHIRHLAADLGMSEAETLTGWKQLEDLGLVQRKGKRLLIADDVWADWKNRGLL